MRLTLFEGCKEGGETIMSGVFAVDVTETRFLNYFRRRF
jgi:hypothetical protein